MDAKLGVIAHEVCDSTSVVSVWPKPSIILSPVAFSNCLNTSGIERLAR